MKWLFLFLIVTLPVRADDIADAVHGGRYVDAIALGEDSDDPRMLFLAARAALIEGGFNQQGDDAVRLLHKAIGLSHRAYSLDSQSLDIRLTLAMALGFEAKRQGSLSLAKRSRNIIKTLATDFPNDQMGPGSLAGWHSEVAAEGFAARLALGARGKTAGKLFAVAERLAGDAPIAFNLEYAKYLARRGTGHYPAALTRLDKITALPATEAFDGILRKRAAALSEAIRTGRPKLVQKRIREATAFNGIKKWDALPGWQED